MNEIAYWVAEKMNTIARDALYNSDTYKSLQQKHSVEGKPFVMQVSLGTTEAADGMWPHPLPLLIKWFPIVNDCR